MYSEEEMYVGDGNTYKDNVEEEYEEFNFDEEENNHDVVYSNDKCVAPDVLLADLDYLTIYDLDSIAYEKAKNTTKDEKPSLIRHKFEDSLKSYNMKVVEIPPDMDRKLLSDYWDINCDKYEVNRNCKENKLVAMEENDFIDLQGKIMDRFWSFEEDFKIMICAFFYDDPTYAFDVLDRSMDEVNMRYETLKNAEKFKFLEKTFSLWPSEYLKLLKSIPLHENDIEVIRSMPSDRLLSKDEMRQLKRNLLLPMDKEMIMYYWKIYHDKNLLYGQLEDRTDSYRPSKYVMDDVEKKDDVDFTRTHRYLFNAVPGTFPGFQKIFSSTFLKSFVASDPIVTLTFEDAVDEYVMWKPRVLLSYSSKFEIIPLVFRDKVYRPTRPYNMAVLIFWKGLELYVLNLCFYPITVGLKFVPSRNYIKIPTDKWTSVCLRPTQSDQIEFIIKPNFHYFTTGINPKMLPRYDRLLFSFSKHNVRRTIDKRYNESQYVQRYRGLLNRTRTNNALKLAEDDIEFIQDLQTNHLINRERVLRKEKAPIDSEIIADLLNDIVENVDISLKGGVWRKNKVTKDSFPMKSKVFYVNNLPKKNIKDNDKTYPEIFNSLKSRNYMMKDFTGYHPVDYIYSSLLSRKQDKDKIRRDAKILDEKFKRKEIRIVPLPKTAPVKETQAVRTLPSNTKLIPLKMKKKIADEDSAKEDDIQPTPNKKIKKKDPKSEPKSDKKNIPKPEDNE